MPSSSPAATAFASGSLPAKISNLDVAPTIAKLLGVALPSAKGKPLPLQ